MKLNKILTRHNKRPLSWIIWHPHQGLWNWDLVNMIKKAVPVKVFNKCIIELIIFADTIILFVHAVVRRISRVGLSNLLGRTIVPDETSILYFDLGTHRKAEELLLVVNKMLPNICKKFKAYGFEAIQEYYEEAKKRVAGKNNVTLIHAALCYKLPDYGSIKISKNEAGSSIYRTNNNSYENVNAMRFSDYIRTNNIDFKNNIVILRMNIEGAEFDVISDLIKSGLAKNIDGYFGMWDDVSKIDELWDNQFRALLTKNHIYPFTFNGRDFWSRFSSSFRLKCIQYELNTSIQAGLRRVKQHAKT